MASPSSPRGFPFSGERVENGANAERGDRAERHRGTEAVSKTSPQTAHARFHAHKGPSRKAGARAGRRPPPAAPPPPAPPVPSAEEIGRAIRERGEWRYDPRGAA